MNALSKDYESKQAKTQLRACSSLLTKLCETEEILFSDLISGFKRIINSSEAVERNLNDNDKQILELQKSFVDCVIENYISPASFIMSPAIHGDQ